MGNMTGSLVVLLLAERARSEGARSTRAIEDRPGRPVRKDTSELGVTIYSGRSMRAMETTPADSLNTGEEVGLVGHAQWETT